MADRSILESPTEWLNDKLINSCQRLLKAQYPHIGEFQSTLFGDNLSFSIEVGQFVQILHRQSHWFCITTIGCKEGEVKVLDSMFNHLPKREIQQIAALVYSKLPSITLMFLDVAEQEGSSDCGLYAIAAATALCESKDPCSLQFHQTEMRSHLLACLEAGVVTGFPSKKRRVRHKVQHTQVVELYCHCRQPSCGKMIQCPQCLEWFHKSCENITAKHWKQPGSWACSNCT